MQLRLKYYFLKFELLRTRINTKLPRLLRVTKIGLVTSLVCFVLATSIVVAKEKCGNLRNWVGDQRCEGASNESQVPATIGTLYSIAAGHEEYTEDGGVAIKGSLLVAVNNMVVEVYEQTDQISGVKHVAQTLEDAKIIQPVYAAAPGYRAFEPIRKVWTVMRNIALSFIVMIGLILSIMILLRVRQGQGYVTMLTALPKLIATIVLVVFSYAIAGVLVDFGNVMEKLVVGLFFNADFIDEGYWQNLSSEYKDGSQYPVNIYGPGTDWSDEQRKGHSEDYYKDMNVFRLMSVFTEVESWGKVECNGRTPPDWWVEAGNEGCPLRIADIIRTPTSIGVLDRGIDLVEKVPADELLKLIFTIVIITGVLKVFMSLITAFAKMLIYTIFAPLVFLFFPLAPGALTGWFRYFLASSLVFPFSFLMMMLAAIIMGYPHAPWFTAEQGVTIAGVAPDLLTYSTSRLTPAGGSGSGEVIFLTKILALVIVMMIPHLSAWLMEILRVPENLMLREAKASFGRIAGKVPIVGGMLSGAAS